MNALVTACVHALEHNMNVKAGESVLIVTDEQKRRIGKVFADAARQFTKQVELVEIPVREFNGQEPPDPVAEKMKHADVVLMPLAKSLSWTRARMRACEHGARIASMARITEAMILRTFPIDYKEIMVRVNRFCDLLDSGNFVKITTKLGTDLSFSIKDRQAHGRKSGFYTRRGYWGNLPCGEAFIAPLEGTANGVYIADASQAGVGKISEPIKISVKDGYAEKIEGGEEAQAFAKMLQGVGDKNAYNIAEFGIGCNDKAIICGITLEDEKVLGTCHIALGSNIFFDGKIEVGVHVDGVLRQPSIYLDGQKIMEAGNLLLR